MMYVNEGELLYLFSTITQALAAMLGIGIIVISFINEKSKYLLERLWSLANDYWKSQNLGSSELRNIGMASDESLLDFLKSEAQEIEKRNPDLYSLIKKIRGEYESQPKLVSPLLYVSLICAVAGMLFSSIGLINASEWSNTITGSIFAGLAIVLFFTAIVTFLYLILKTIIPVISIKKSSR